LTSSQDQNRSHDSSENTSLSAPRVIKKYPNRRLYDTHTSSYVTLQEIKALVIQAETIKVVDAKSNEDLTRSIFLQIILEEEAAGMPLFSEAALANIIRFYGHSMQGLMGSFLERNIQQFLDMQFQMAQQAQQMSPDKWAQILSNPVGSTPSVLSNMTQQSNQFLIQMHEQILKAMGLKR
jgi:polyhydroxyalkanoate synthesis repressor PhaR